MTIESKRDGELSLSEMLANPIGRTLMTHDGVTRDEVEGLFAALQAKLAGGRAERRPASRPRPEATARGS